MLEPQTRIKTFILRERVIRNLKLHIMSSLNKKRMTESKTYGIEHSTRPRVLLIF